MVPFSEKIKDFSRSCPNKFLGRRGMVPDVIVLHNTGGNKISSAHYWFLDPKSQTSAHYLVGKDGEIRQYVSLADGSWCNGTTTDRTKMHYHGNSSSPIVRSRKQNANLYTVSVEFVGTVGSTLTAEQMTAAVELLAYVTGELERIYGRPFPLDGNHLLTHSTVAPLTRGDCGRNIPVGQILNALKERRDAEAVKPKIGDLRGSGGRIASYVGKGSNIKNAVALKI